MPKVQHGRIHGTSLFLVRFRPYSVILNVQWRRLFYHSEYVNAFSSFILGIPRGSFPCRHPACSRQEGQAECQHANAPPRQVPGRAVIVPKIAPRLPSQHWGQCRHHQGGLAQFVIDFPFSNLRSLLRHIRGRIAFVFIIVKTMRPSPELLT